MTREEYQKLKFKKTNLLGCKLFDFQDYQDWVNHATARYSSIGLSKEDRKELCITLDSMGRLCRRGGDFMRARDEKTFPVSVYIMNFTI